MRTKRLNHIVRIIFCGSLFAGAVVAQDPPSRVARLNYLQGSVSMQPAGLDDWSQAVVNRPFTIGDSLYTASGAQAELHMDVAVMRMGPQTNFSFLNLDDQSVQIKLTAGNMYFRIRNFGPNQVFEVDTPNAAVTLLREGVYRFNVDPDGNSTFVVVRQGQAEVTGGGQAFTLDPGNSVSLSGSDQLAYDVEVAPGQDQFDSWCAQRDNHEAHLQSIRYVSPTVIGYEDLDDYGDWQIAPTYGAVWYPRHVESGWAPYHNGHWAWVQPWGWTWVDDAPWGFAPFHYGRWAFVEGRWGWCPGPRAVQVASAPVIRAHYAPALVAFFGGAHWGVSLSIGGGGPSLGWVPLGYGEVYTPPYRVSQNYFRNVNVSNTNIDKRVNITNVYNNTYVNKTTNVTNVTNVTVVNNNQRYVNMSAPGAVTAMPQAAFASGRSVARSAVSVSPAEAARIQPGTAAMLRPSVAPVRQVLAPAARPPQQMFARQVIARHAPPMRAGAPAMVRQAPVVSRAAVAVHVGERVGQPAAVARPAGPSPRPAEASRPAPAPAPANAAVTHVREHTGRHVSEPADERARTPRSMPPAAPVRPEPAARSEVHAPAAHPPAVHAAPAHVPEAHAGEPHSAPAAKPRPHPEEKKEDEHRRDPRS